SWCSCGAQPRVANHPAKGGGKAGRGERTGRSLAGANGSCECPIPPARQSVVRFYSDPGRSAAMPYVQIESLFKAFGDTEVLHGVGLEIEKQEFTVFVGPSGCGKTTLLRLIAGLEEVTSGTIRIGDKRVDKLPPAERGVAMVFQNYALYPHMSVYENMSFGLRIAKVAKALIRGRVSEAAGILQINELLERKPP